MWFELRYGRRLVTRTESPSMIGCVVAGCALTIEEPRLALSVHATGATKSSAAGANVRAWPRLHREEGTPQPVGEWPIGRAARNVHPSLEMTSPSQVTLHQELQRFAGRFSARIADALTEPLASPEPDVSNAALGRALTYSAAAFDIATGPYADVNLLDMVVFVRLSREVLDDHWVPRMFREQGVKASRVFAESEEELWAIAARTLDDPRRAELAKAIDDWHAEHPTLLVESVRLDDFAAEAGVAAAGRAKLARGLLSSVRSAARTAGDALLLGERAMFLVQRLPTLMRMQARLAVREIASDVLSMVRVELPFLASLLRWVRRLPALRASRAGA